MAVNSRITLRDLLKLGWRIVGQRGSHVQLKHPDKKARVTLPHPKRDIPKGTLASIEKQSGHTFK